MKILYFIDSLLTGGKERRVLELISFLSKNPEYEILVVLTSNNIQYSKFFELNISHKIIELKSNKNPLRFIHFYHICKCFNPDIIHAWRMMNAFYALPSVIFQGIPLVNSQITSGNVKKDILNRFCNLFTFYFSKAIVANSFAGLKAHKITREKGMVIHNGVNLERFINLPTPQLIKEKYGIKTKYAVVMIASYSKNKNYNLFINVAKKVTQICDDITFISAGGTTTYETEFNKLKQLTQSEDRIILLKQISEVEALVNACDIGVLFTFSEGISNAIIEYMALGKPVVTNDRVGGTGEIVNDNETGYIIKEDTVDHIADLLIDLINDSDRREIMGNKGKEKIYNSYNIEKMSSAFEKVYHQLIE